MRHEVIGDVLRLIPETGRVLDLDFASIEVGPDLRTALVERFVELAGPSGSWGSVTTHQAAISAVRSFFADLGVNEATELTGLMYRERLLSWSATVRHARHLYLRRILPSLQGVGAGCVHAIESTTARRPDRVQTGVALTDDDIDSLRICCFDTVRDALARTRRGWCVVEAYRRGEYDESHRDLEYARCLEEIARTGDIAARGKVPGRRIVPLSVRRRLFPPGAHARVTIFPLWEDLYPTPAEIAAAVLGLIITCGWNLGTARRLTVGDINRVDSRDGSEPLHLRVRLHKPRRGQVGAWTETYSDAGARSKARLLSMVLELTEGVRRTMRDAGHPSDAVLVCLARGLNSRHAPRPLPFTVLADADGGTVSKYLALWRADHPELDFATPRTLRSFFATQVHPQGHSLNTNLDYNLADPTVRAAVQPVIASALQDHYDDVRARVVASSSATPREAPEAAALGVLGDINEGRRDTVAAACVDHEHAPDTHEPCRASFLTCFACKNAVVLKRHLPRVTAVYEELEALRSVVVPSAWNERFAAHHARVGTLLEPDRYFSEAELTAARDSISAADRDRVARLMRRDWDA